MIHLKIPQYGDEWFQERLGRPCSSEFHNIFTAKTLALSKSADKYLYRLAAEAILREPVEKDIVAWAVQRGKDLECEAVQYYELTRGVATQEAGFILTNDRRIGCSPDRLVGDEGLLEIKAPLASTHLAYLDEGVLPMEYRLQVYGQLYVSERKFCDFLSYYPGLPSFLIRVEPDPEIQEKMHRGLTEFVDRLDAMKKKLMDLY